MYRKKELWISLILTFIGFTLIYGIDALNPSSINWLMSAYHDWGQHYLGWAYFQQEPWHFPIGHIENYSYPAGTNIGFTDSIPLLALFFKVFRFLLPDTFQYFGLWILSCYLLISYFTFKVLELFTQNTILIVLSVLLVSFNPVLIYRGMHPALCAQWLIVASIYYYLKKTNKENVDVVNKRQIVILLTSALVNPYLFFMVFGFNVILPFKHYYIDKLISLKRVFIYIFSATFLVLLSWYIVGMISFKDDTSLEVDNAYGLYGLNLNSFYNSSGWSSIFQPYSIYAPQQYEGFSYLGLGVFILIILGLVYKSIKLVRNRSSIKKYYKLIPLLLLLTAFTLFAISNQVTINDSLVLELELPDLILKVGNIFRASGRFIWVLYYSLLLFFLIVYSKIKISKNFKILVLLIILSVQFYDIQLFFKKDLPSGNYEIEGLNEEKWIAMTANFDKIVTYPPHENSLGYSSDYQDWCFIALKNNLPITNGYTARESGDTNLIFRQKIKMDLEEGIIGKNDFYVTSPEHIDDFSALIYNRKVNLGYLDGYYYLYSKENRNMDSHQFEPLELQKTDSIVKEIEKLSKVETLTKPDLVNEKIQFNIEKNTFNNNILNIQGWAFLKDNKIKSNDSVFILLSNDKISYLLKTISFERADVSAHYNIENLKNIGFKARIFTDKMKNGQYKILVGIKTDNDIIFEFDDQSILKLQRETTPLEIKTLPESVDSILFNVEEILQETDAIYIKGWAFISEQNTVDSEIQITLENDNNIYSTSTSEVKRQDVTSYFNHNFNYDNSGFELRIKKQKLKKGTYKLGFLIHNDNKTIFRRTDKTVNI